MCMILANLTHRIPRKVLFGPKVVYKVMKKEPKDEPGVIRSPHRGHPYELDFRQDHFISKTKNYSGKYLVQHGFHSFPNIEDAKAELEELRRKQQDSNFRYREFPTLHDKAEFSIYECEIPQGALYYVGFWEYHYPYKEIPNIVSNSLYIMKKVAE